MRKIKTNTLYRHFKGMKVYVDAIAKDSEDEHLVVVYHHIDNPTDVWVRDYEMFVGLVDKDKYPDVIQKYRFEEIE